MRGYLFWIALSEAVGGISAWLTRAGMESYNSVAIKPPLSPAPVVFATVWTVLYALMGAGMARIDRFSATVEKSRTKSLFFFQLAMNFCWSIIFFNLRGYGFALIWLVVMAAAVALMTAAFSLLDKAAGAMQLPYLIWTLFAIYLNFMVWRLN